MSKTDAAGESGFALLIVAITLATLSLIIGTVIYVVRLHANELASDIAQLKLRSALDGGIAVAVERLSFGGQITPLLLRQPEKLDMSSISVVISARPEISKLNLNTADPVRIAALLEVSGISTDFAQRLADEIVDWRDPDSEPRPSGAEASEYLAAGRSYVPPNSGFETVSELSMILDGSAALTACLEPDVTVFGNSAQIAAQYASSRLREALILTHAAPAAQQSILGATVSSNQAIIAGEIFEIDEKAVDRDSGLSTSRETLLRVTGNSRDPVRILFQSPVIPGETKALEACAHLERNKAR